MQIERDVLEGGSLRCQPGLGRESEDAPGRLVEEFAKMQRAVGCLDLARQREIGGQAARLDRYGNRALNAEVRG